ncbi:unnamed protein product [Closterium sp. Naga37s-1]|nr:unnamed protein product [Closterium sp. Naga37s-1]
MAHKSMAALLAVLLLLHVGGSLAVTVAQRETNALLSMKLTLNGGAVLKNWIFGKFACANAFTGVTCKNGAVVGLSLPKKTLSGSLGTVVGYLNNLQSLDLSGNSIAGAIPEEVAFCTALTSINLGSNKFTGDIPQRLGNLQNLNTLILSGNALKGDVPLNLFSAKKLSVLLLNNNRLSGRISELTGDPTKSLVNVDLSNNLLTGPLPPLLVRSAGLKNLNLANNGFTGGLPVGWLGLNSLKALSVANNALGGPILPGIANLKALTTVSFANNKFFGTVGKAFKKFKTGFKGNPQLCVDFNGDGKCEVAT